jgi:hypothetical protein
LSGTLCAGLPSARDRSFPVRAFACDLCSSLSSASFLPPGKSCCGAPEGGRRCETTAAKLWRRCFYWRERSKDRWAWVTAIACPLDNPDLLSCSAPGTRASWCGTLLEKMETTAPRAAASLVTRILSRTLLFPQMISSRCPTPGTEPPDCGISIQVRLLGLLEDTPRMYAALHSTDRSFLAPGTRLSSYGICLETLSAPYTTRMHIGVGWAAYRGFHTTILHGNPSCIFLAHSAHSDPAG